VWIIDPIDGTNEFAEPPRHDWAVHVALWERGRLTAASVALPALGITFDCEPAPTVPASSRARPLLVTSRTRNPYSAVVVANALGCDVGRLGSAGAKAMAVVMGEADVYVHDGGMYQWDSAAPVAVALAAGLHVSRIDGSALEYNQPSLWLPDLLICRPELAPPALAALAAHL
jgi:3'(2'), 5'-bisphosphate nucleotidase